MKVSKLLGCRDRLQDILVFQIRITAIYQRVVSHSPDQNIRHIRPYACIRKVKRLEWIVFRQRSIYVVSFAEP